MWKKYQLINVHRQSQFHLFLHISTFCAQLNAFQNLNSRKPRSLMIYTCSCSATVKVEHPRTKAVATLKMIASEQLKVLGNCSLQGFFCEAMGSQYF